MNNTTKCPSCTVTLIYEESINHTCTPNYRIRGDFLWVRRNGHWRRLNLTNISRDNQNEHPTDFDNEKNRRRFYSTSSNLVKFLQTLPEIPRRYTSIRLPSFSELFNFFWFWKLRQRKSKLYPFS